jgi:hypothetical protein
VAEHDRETGKGLTRREFEAIIGRAAELSASDPGNGEAELSEAELFRIAGEVGLSGVHVRQALAEVRSNLAFGGPLDRWFGLQFVRAARVVPGNRSELSKRLDDFLVGTQLLQSVRRGSEVLLYRPSVDWASQIARAASSQSRKYYIASAKSVEVHLQQLEDGRSHVEIIVDPGTRGDSVGGVLVFGGLGGATSGAFVGWVLSMLAPVALGVGVGILLGGAVTGGIIYLTGASAKKKLLEVRVELEGILDAVELGESLEPPPASWRRWVKRHFHGVARDVMRSDDADDA